MNYYVALSIVPLQNAIAIIDGIAGYPKPGVNVGGGVHVPGLFVTTTYAPILANTSGLAWAYPMAGLVAANAIALAGLGLGAPIALDGTWANATIV